MKKYIVIGMTCAMCQAHVEKAVGKVEGVSSVTVSLLTNSMVVEGIYSDEAILHAVQQAGYQAIPFTAEESSSKESSVEVLTDALSDKETPQLKKRLKVSFIFLFLLMFITVGNHVFKLPLPDFFVGNYIGLALMQMILTMIILGINHKLFYTGVTTLWKGMPTMDTLVSLGSGVSFLWSISIVFKMTYMITTGNSGSDLESIYYEQLYFESAAMIPTFIIIGKILESISKGRTTNALKSLLQMKPKTAMVERSGKEIVLPVEEIVVGDIFIVKPGESVPVDGVIIEGATSINESALTGESIPVDKEVGDKISAATINTVGFIRAKALYVGEDTTFSQIIKLMSEASATKAPIARGADKVASIFVPSIMMISLFVFIGWLLYGASLAHALEYAISVLVISCPCTLGLATPVAIMVGSTVGAKNGILFKTGEALENTGKVRMVALDKTGTITKGQPYVTDVIPASGVTSTEFLALAYSLEVKSEHPLSKAIVDFAKEQSIDAVKVDSFKVFIGNGIEGSINHALVHAGSLRFIKQYISLDFTLLTLYEKLTSEGKTPILFEKNKKYMGLIAVSDIIKEDSAFAISKLRKLGIKTIMMTGDNEKTAHAIGMKAGVDQIFANVLPDAKEKNITQWKEHGLVAMVGDGINDAPALASADIGMAIGAGTDVAIESADVVLVNSSLMDIVSAVQLSRATLKNVYENLFWGFAYNMTLIPLAAGLYPNIHITPMWGAAIMALSSVTVCLNALRLNNVKLTRPTEGSSIIDPKEINTSLNVKENKEMKVAITIEGMMCGHCEMMVKKAFEEMDAVISAEVSHEKGQAILTLKSAIQEADIKTMLESKGYKFKHFKNLD
ncbi:MAG: heavy metal translocating P-type ATPase [Dialister sp.]|nr:heavy metal translocating P-type ATPase [Dialister sp.]